MRRTMRISIALGLVREDWDEATSYVVEAERLGVASVWSAEAWGYDAVTPLAYLAAKTSRIRLGSGIMQAGTRTPALVAMTAMSLASLSADRFLLGLGVSGPQVIEGWHGIRFERPLQRMREIIEIVRLAASGERLRYKGKVYELPLPGGEGKALRSGAQPMPQVPIYLATLGPKSLEMTGELADGWLGTSFMPERILRPYRRGCRTCRPFAHGDRSPGGWGCRILRRSRPADSSPQARPRLHARCDGVTGAQLLQRRVQASWI